MKKKRINVSHRYSNVQILSGLLVCGLGVCTLIGWAVNISALKSIGTGFIAMNPLTAVNLIVFGTWLLVRGNSGSKYFTVVVLIVNGLIVVSKIAEIIFPSGIKIDSVLFAGVLGTHKMSPAVVLNFFLLGLAFVFSYIKVKQKEFLFQGMVILAFAVSAVYLCGYLFNYNSLTQASVLTPMALNSCIAFLILCVALLFNYPDKGFMRPLLSKKLGGVMARKILPLLIVIPVLTGALKIWGQHFKLYNGELGVAIHVVIIAFLSFFLSYYFAKKLNEIDAVRKEYENELLEKTKLLHKSELLLEETASLAKVGGWEVTFPDHKVSYTRQIYTIREISEDDHKLSFAGALDYYTSESSKLLEAHYQEALREAKPYELELKLITSKKREVWVRVKGHPICDDNGNVIALHGTLQDIDEEKKKEILLQQSNEIINEQNKRLMNFTHIVSHNLRTHAANIKSTLALYNSEKNEEEKPQILKMTNKAADALNQTIADLNGIIATQSSTKQLKSSLLFKEVFSTACQVLDKEIRSSKAMIKADFSVCEAVEYVPAYLESIFHNFLSNSIKYRKPDVQPEINVKTMLKGDKVMLVFSDNGIGIDLDKYRDKLFGMYKTFHHHPDATGVGLFLTKSQVESLGGSILVESEVNKGTTFKVIF